MGNNKLTRFEMSGVIAFDFPIPYTETKQRIHFFTIISAISEINTKTGTAEKILCFDIGKKSAILNKNKEVERWKFSITMTVLRSA